MLVYQALIDTGRSRRRQRPGITNSRSITRQDGNMKLTLSNFDAVTFDVYGTLIDWEPAITALSLQVGPTQRTDDPRRRIADGIRPRTHCDPDGAARPSLP